MSEQSYETADAINENKQIDNDNESVEHYEYEEGDIYEGEWNHEGKKHGLGSIKFVDGSSYQGIFRNGLFDGFGVLEFHDNTKFEGEFHNGRFHGFGTYTRCDRMIYEGRFCDGAPRGAGLITFSDGSNGSPRYEGYFDGFKLTRRADVAQELVKARKSTERARRCTRTFF